MSRLGKHWRVVAVGLVALVLVAYAFCQQKKPGNPGPDIVVGPTDNLTVYFIDVGQGDAVLVDCGSYECLIDAGTMAPAIPAGVIQVPLESVVATHPHADHIGGLPAVFSGQVVKDFWYNGESSGTQAYSDMMVAVQNEVGCTVHEAHTGDYIKTLGTGDGLAIRVVHSGGGLDTNDSSIVVQVVYGESSWVFMGDAQENTEQGMVVAGAVKHVDVLKVGHHGSCSGTTDGFLTASSPQIAVISVGAGNPYGHPCPAVLERLQAHGVAVYRTDTSGTIVLTTDGSSPVVEKG